MPAPTLSKPRLRTEMRARRQALGAASRSAAAAAAATHITQLPGWLSARRVALYLANDGELDTAAVAAVCRAAGKGVFLPVLADGNRLLFALWDEDKPLTGNRFGIPEPDGSATRCDPADLDIVVMPLVAWDIRGVRLGMGGGFYDRTLAGVGGPLRVGLGYAFQQVPCLPKDEWDVPLDFVLTDKALHDCSPAAGAAAPSPG